MIYVRTKGNNSQWLRKLLQTVHFHFVRSLVGLFILAYPSFPLLFFSFTFLFSPSPTFFPLSFSYSLNKFKPRFAIHINITRTYTGLRTPVPTRIYSHIYTNKIHVLARRQRKQIKAVITFVERVGQNWLSEICLLKGNLRETFS